VKARFVLTGAYEQVVDGAAADLSSPGGGRRADGDGFTELLLERGPGPRRVKLRLAREGEHLLVTYTAAADDFPACLPDDFARWHSLLPRECDPALADDAWKVFRALARVPGVGPLVDREGLPRDRQPRRPEGTSRVAAGSPPPPSTPPSTGAASPPRASGEDAGGTP
jgi:hypothetical protein